MVPATNSTKPIESHEIFKLSEKEVRQSMTTEEIIQSFKEHTGITLIRASKEGVLKDYNVDTDFPEVLAAMLATVFGASVTAITDFSEEGDLVVQIRSGDHTIVIVSSTDDIVGVFVPEGTNISDNDLLALARQLEESEY